MIWAKHNMSRLNDFRFLLYKDIIINKKKIRSCDLKDGKSCIVIPTIFIIPTYIYAKYILY